MGLDSGSLDYLGVEEEEVVIHRGNRTNAKTMHANKFTDRFCKHVFATLPNQAGFLKILSQVRGRLLREVARRRGEQYPHDKATKYDLDHYIILHRKSIYNLVSPPIKCIYLVTKLQFSLVNLKRDLNQKIQKIEQFL